MLRAYYHSSSNHSRREEDSKINGVVGQAVPIAQNPLSGGGTKWGGIVTGGSLRSSKKANPTSREKAIRVVLEKEYQIPNIQIEHSTVEVPVYVPRFASPRQMIMSTPSSPARHADIDQAIIADLEKGPRPQNRVNKDHALYATRSLVPVVSTRKKKSVTWCTCIDDEGSVEREARHRRRTRKVPSRRKKSRRSKAAAHATTPENSVLPPMVEYTYTDKKLDYGNEEEDNLWCKNLYESVVTQMDQQPL